MVHTTVRNERQFDYATLEAWGIPEGTDCDHVLAMERVETHQRWDCMRVVFRAPDDHRLWCIPVSFDREEGVTDLGLDPDEPVLGFEVEPYETTVVKYRLAPPTRRDMVIRTTIRWAPFTQPRSKNDRTN